MLRRIYIYMLCSTISVPLVTETTSADIYRYRANNGVVHYCNKPDSNRYELYRKTTDTYRQRKKAHGNQARSTKNRVNTIHRQKADYSRRNPLNAATENSNRLQRSPKRSGKHPYVAVYQPNEYKYKKDNPARRNSSGIKGRSHGLQYKYTALIRRIARKHDLPPALLRAMIKVESNFNPRAVSNKGAAGLMQIMPMNYPSLNIDDPFDPEQNVNGGAQYLKQMLKRFGGDIVLALAAYNAGPAPVIRHGYQLPYRETRKYVRKVLQYYDRYKKKPA